MLTVERASPSTSRQDKEEKGRHGHVKEGGQGTRGQDCETRLRRSVPLGRRNDNPGCQGEKRWRRKGWLRGHGYARGRLRA
jgi:hypothetical protein